MYSATHLLLSCSFSVSI
jgi:hypothetical protein